MENQRNSLFKKQPQAPISTVVDANGDLVVGSVWSWDVKGVSREFQNGRYRIETGNIGRIDNEKLQMPSTRYRFDIKLFCREKLSFVGTLPGEPPTMTRPQCGMFSR